MAALHRPSPTAWPDIHRQHQGTPGRRYNEGDSRRLLVGTLVLRLRKDVSIFGGLAVADDKPYTTQLQAGLGLVTETKTLLDLWTPGMSANQLHRIALDSGRFPSVTARRLRNIVVECFAPRYLVAGGTPAKHLKRLGADFHGSDLAQLMLLFTSRANPILERFYSPRLLG